MKRVVFYVEGQNCNAACAHARTVHGINESFDATSRKTTTHI